MAEEKRTRRHFSSEDKAAVVKRRPNARRGSLYSTRKRLFSH